MYYIKICTNLFRKFYFWEERGSSGCFLPNQSANSITDVKSITKRSDKLIVCSTKQRENRSTTCSLFVLSAWREEGENRRFGQSEQREQSELAHYAESREIEDKRSAVNPPPATKRDKSKDLSLFLFISFL